jgi:hypothetical protein
LKSNCLNAYGVLYDELSHVAVDRNVEGEDEKAAPVPLLEATVSVSLGALADDKAGVQGRRPHSIYFRLGSRS